MNVCGEVAKANDCSMPSICQEARKGHKKACPLSACMQFDVNHCEPGRCKVGGTGKEYCMMKSLTPARFRFAVQLLFASFCLFVGFRFMAFLDWAMGRNAEMVTRPGAVEAFLPISALLGLRQLVATGEWDMVHPAGLTVFIAVLCMAFLFRNGFCGYICPVGFLSSQVERIGRTFKLAIIPHKYVDYPLSILKYALLGFFLYTVFFAMDLRTASSFISSPYNMVADARMLHFFVDPSTTSLIVIGVLCLASLIVRNAWCRYLCPYGALLGLLSWLGPVTINRDAQSCIHCGRCTRHCPAGILVENKKSVHSPQCIGCGECIGACPVDGCLSFKAYRRIRIPWYTVGIGVIVVLLGFYTWAQMTGHWQAPMPPSMLKKIYLMFLESV